MAAPDAREAEHKYLAVQQFGSLNSQPSRTALEQNEFAWIENFMPIGDAYAPAVPGPGAAIASLNPSQVVAISAGSPGTELWGASGAATVTPSTAAVIVTWDPLYTHPSFILEDGNLLATKDETEVDALSRATLGRSTGKYYFEVVIGTETGGIDYGLGVVTTDAAVDTWVGKDTESWGYWKSGRRWHNNAFTEGYPTYDSGDVIMIAIDLDADKVWFGREGTWNGDPAAGTDPAYSSVGSGETIYPACSPTDILAECRGHFAAANFVHPIPSGFSAWQS